MRTKRALAGVVFPQTNIKIASTKSQSTLEILCIVVELEHKNDDDARQFFVSIT